MLDLGTVNQSALKSILERFFRPNNGISVLFHHFPFRASVVQVKPAFLLGLKLLAASGTPVNGLHFGPQYITESSSSSNVGLSLVQPQVHILLASHDSV